CQDKNFLQVEKQMVSSRSHLALILVGFLAIAVSFFAYAKNNNLIITPAAMPALQNLAVATYLVLLASFAAIGWGLYKMYKTKITSVDSTISSIIANAIHNKRSKQIFVISAIGYGFPKTPHIELSPCCDLPGYMPMIFAFFTEHVGLQIIPLNLLLLVTVSFLVGLNFAISATVFSIAKSGGKLGAFGAVTGLFVGCPTCAGTIFTMLFGFGAGATTFTLFLTSFEAQIQTIFIAISIPVLLVTPIIMAKKLKSQNESCAVKP